MNAPWAEEGLSISFSVPATGERMALRNLVETLKKNEVEWFKRVGNEWRLDADRLKATDYFYKDGLDWLAGTLTIEPTFDFNAIGRINIRFIVYKEDFLLSPKKQ